VADIHCSTVDGGCHDRDLIWFFNYFLTGELTTRFLLKALTVMMICGAIFVYYLSSLRWDRNADVARAKRRSFKFGAGAAAAVMTAFCIGLGIAGTPHQQRHIEADRRRTQDLRGDCVCSLFLVQARGIGTINSHLAALTGGTPRQRSQLIADR
jgi:hypothetical protein